MELKEGFGVAGLEVPKRCGLERIRKRESNKQGITLGVMTERNATKGQHGREQGMTKGRGMLRGEENISESGAALS